MTCEVAVMNKRGVALAADSAVTLGDGQKVYHTAEKLFQLSSSVGIMTFGAADIMGVPWETVIKLYSQKLGGRSLDQLEQYARGFLQFIEESESLFPDSAQCQSFRELVGGYWREWYLDPLMERLDGDAKGAGERANAIFSELIARDIEECKNCKPLQEMGDGYGERVIAKGDAVLNELEEELFGRFKLSRKVRAELRATTRYRYEREDPEYDDWSPLAPSGIVIAGFGEAEAFPVVMSYLVGTVAAGKLRFTKREDAHIGQKDVDANVIPFAQRHVIDMFYGGILPPLREKLEEMVVNGVAQCLKRTGGKRGAITELSEKCARGILKEFDSEARDSHSEPLLQAVAALPRRELARLAEALVNLTAFMAEMSADQVETVGGPIDIALISKGDGFVWIKHKDPSRDPVAL